MPATRLSEITNQMIIDRLLQIESVSVTWAGHMPADAESYGAAAQSCLPDVGVAEVRAMLERQHIGGDTPADEIDMAISMACEPDGLPDNACVDLLFAD